MGFGKIKQPVEKILDSSLTMMGNVALKLESELESGVDTCSEQ